MPRKDGRANNLVRKPGCTPKAGPKSNPERPASTKKTAPKQPFLSTSRSSAHRSGVYRVLSPIEFAKEKIDHSILQNASRYNWSEDATFAALEYADYLCTGKGSFQEILAKLQRCRHSKIKDLVEKRFATTILLNKEKLGDVDMPGKQMKVYAKNLVSAGKRLEITS